MPGPFWLGFVLRAINDARYPNLRQRHRASADYATQKRPHVSAAALREVRSHGCPARSHSGVFFCRLRIAARGGSGSRQGQRRCRPWQQLRSRSGRVCIQPHLSFPGCRSAALWGRRQPPCYRPDGKQQGFVSEASQPAHPAQVGAASPALSSRRHSSCCLVGHLGSSRCPRTRTVV